MKNYDEDEACHLLSIMRRHEALTCVDQGVDCRVSEVRSSVLSEQTLSDALDYIHKLISEALITDYQLLHHKYWKAVSDAMTDEMMTVASLLWTHYQAH